MIFESHAHYDSQQYDEDRDAVLSAMPQHNVGTIVNSAADWESVTEVVELAEKYFLTNFGKHFRLCTK